MSIIMAQMRTKESPSNDDKWWVVLTQPEVDVHLGSTKNPKNSNQSKNGPKYHKQMETNNRVGWSDRGEKTRAFIQPLSNLANHIQYQKIADYKLMLFQISTIINSIWPRNKQEIQPKELPNQELKPPASPELKLLKPPKNQRLLQLPQLIPPLLLQFNQQLPQPKQEPQPKIKKLEILTDHQQRNQEQKNQKPHQNQRLQEPKKSLQRKHQPRKAPRLPRLVKNDFNFIFQHQNVVILFFFLFKVQVTNNKSYYLYSLSSQLFLIVF